MSWIQLQKPAKKASLTAKANRPKPRNTFSLSVYTYNFKVIDKMAQNKTSVKLDLSGEVPKKYEVSKALNTKGPSGQSESYDNTHTNRSFCNVCL